MSTLSQDALDRIVSSLSKHRMIHGAVFHVESEDRSLRLFSAAGNLRPESPYYIASINKLVISFITLRMVLDGRIGLDDRITTYLPPETTTGLIRIDGVDHTSELTIRHLISHTSGLPCYLVDKGPDGKKNMDRVLGGEDQAWPMDKVIEVVRQMNPKFCPGTPGKASYAEPNFRLMAAILEVVTGKNINRLMEDVFAELGMEHTFVLNSERAADCAPIYYKQRTIGITNYRESTQDDIASTVSDQMKFIRAVFGGGYFSASFIESLEKWNSIFFPFKYGIGIQKFYMPRILSPFKAVPDSIGHCGSVGSVAFWVPEKRIYITGTVNQPATPNLAFQTMIKIINKL